MLYNGTHIPLQLHTDAIFTLLPFLWKKCVHVNFRLPKNLLFTSDTGWAYRGLTGRFLLLQNFSVAISVSPHVCLILVLILISMFLR